MTSSQTRKQDNEVYCCYCLHSQRTLSMKQLARTKHVSPLSTRTFQMVSKQIPATVIINPHTDMFLYQVNNKQTYKQTNKQLSDIFFFTCCISLAKSGQRALRPDSSKIFSNAMSCNATSVVSNMSRPAWFANMNTGCG